MSDITEGVDNEPQPVDPKPVAPPAGGDTPESTPAPGDTPAPEPEPKPEEGEKQTRREARAFATLRRENRELYRRLGGLEAMLQQAAPQAPSGDGTPPQRQVQQAPSQLDELIIQPLIEKIEDEGPEYEKAVETITSKGYPISEAMRDFLATSKNPAQLAKALADDRNEAQRIYLLGERAADRAMEQLEARVSAKAPPRTTKAPPPVRTVGGSSSVRSDPAKMSMEEYAEWRSKRL